MSADPDQEILLEMQKVGKGMEVRAVAVSDGLEVVFIAPSSTPRSDVERLAVAKLAYVRKRAAGRAVGGAEGDDEGGKLGGRGGVIV